jgi:hypothetical protein
MYVNIVPESFFIFYDVDICDHIIEEDEDRDCACA